MLILGAGFLGYRSLAGMKAAPARREAPKRIKEVRTKSVENTEVATTLTVQGRLMAYNKISLFTEVGGAVRATGKPFKKGITFRKGETLLRIDDTEARLGLQAQKASLMNSIALMMPDLKIDYPESFPNWQAYLSDFEVDSPMAALPEVVNQQEKLFVAGRNIYGQYYNIKSGEERLTKYTLTAPFSGVLTNAVVDQGAVVRPGQELGELMANNFYELVATVALSDLDFLQAGNTVTLHSEDIAGQWSGKIRRIGDQIDPATQTVSVYIGVSGAGLREGMYLRGEARARTIASAVEIDRDLLLDQQAVYIVEADTLLRRHPVEVRKFNRETAIVRGLPQGARLLVSEVAGAYDGMRVQRKETMGAAARTPEEASTSSSRK